MKEVSKDLNTYLNTAKNLTSCDLYELDLTDGRKFYYADTDMDIVYNGQAYLHNRLLIKRAQIKLQSAVVVDTMTVTVYADRQDTLDTEQLLKAALNAAGPHKEEHPYRQNRKQPGRAVN